MRGAGSKANIGRAVAAGATIDDPDRSAEPQLFRMHEWGIIPLQRTVDAQQVA